MNRAHLATMRVLSLLLLLPGMTGLIVSAMVSTHYADTLPTSPAPQVLRMTPREINGKTVYQTEEEDHRLDLMEYGSVAIFVCGLALGLVYLEKWSALRTREAELEGDVNEV